MTTDKQPQPTAASDGIDRRGWDIAGQKNKVTGLSRDRLAALILTLSGVLASVLLVAHVRAALVPLEGIGAVSVGISQELVFSSLLVCNLLLRAAARRAGPIAVRFRLTHFWLTLFYLVFAILSEIWVMRAYQGEADAFYSAVVAVLLVSAPSDPIQLFFAGSALAFLIGRPLQRWTSDVR